MKVTPTGKVLGATIEGLDLSQPLSADLFEQVVHVLGEHGVIRYRSDWHVGDVSHVG